MSNLQIEANKTNRTFKTLSQKKLCPFVIISWKFKSTLFVFIIEYKAVFFNILESIVVQKGCMYQHEFISAWKAVVSKSLFIVSSL